jgi:membrane associated rhomboid family serine protease
MRSITDRLTPSIKWLLIANVFVYFFYVFVKDARPWIALHLALGPGFFSGEIWQPISSLFVHVSPLFFFNLIGLWFVGASVEGAVGTRRFWGVFLGAGLVSNLAIAFSSHVMPHYAMSIHKEGCGYAVLALFVAQGRIFGRTPGRIVGNIYLQARTIAIIFVVWALLVNASQRDWPGVIGTVVTTAIGFFGATPGGWTVLRNFFANARDVSRARRLRRRFGVIDGGDRPSKKYVN